MLDITKLPEIICLKYLAYYLALSSKKFLHYGEILWEDSSWLNNATRIHIVLRQTLEKKLGITLSYAMPPAQLRAAKNAGVELIASVGSDIDISNRLSCDITRELTIELLHLLPEFNYLFIGNNNHPELDQGDADRQGSIQNKKITSVAPLPPKPSLRCQSRTLSLVQAIEQLLMSYSDHVLTPHAIWERLLTKIDDPAYKISKIQGGGSGRTITFSCGKKFDYKNATQHIVNVINWFTSSVPSK